MRNIRAVFNQSSWWRLGLIVTVAAVALVYPPTRWAALGLLGLNFIVAAHEAGHLIAARRTNIGADEFWVGIGPKVWTRTRNGMTWGLRAFPVGGYVKVTGMDDKERRVGYAAASAGRKIVVAAAGPAVNLLMAATTMFVALSMIGEPTLTNKVDKVMESSPAAAVGLVEGDEIVAVNGELITDGQDLLAGIRDGNGPVELTVQRDGQVLTFSVEPDSEGAVRRIGVLTTVRQDRISRADAIFKTGTFMYQASGEIITSIVGLPGQIVPDGSEDRAVSPVGMVQIASQAPNGWTLALLFVSVNLFLGLFNLMPVPPLDGGHIAITVYETVGSKLTGRDVRVSATTVTTVAAAVIVMVVMISATALFNDIVNPVTVP